MMGDGSWMWWGPGIFFMILCMVLMMSMMGSHGSHGSGGSGSSHGDESNGHASAGPERILAERLARGEIDVDEYERRLRVLKQSSELDRTKER